MTGPNTRPELRDDLYKTLIELPTKVFMYTIDQVAMLLDIHMDVLKRNYLFFNGRENRRSTRQDLVAVNIARHDQDPEWRVSEVELVRWMKFKGIKFITPTRPTARSFKK